MKIQSEAGHFGGSEGRPPGCSDLSVFQFSLASAGVAGWWWGEGHVSFPGLFSTGDLGDFSTGDYFREGIRWYHLAGV